MEEQKLILKYDGSEGSSIARHKIKLSTACQSLLALQNLISEAHKIRCAQLDIEYQELDFHIEPFQEGSFEMLAGIENMPEMSLGDWDSLLSILLFAGGTLKCGGSAIKKTVLSTIEWINNRKIKSIEPTNDKEVCIRLEDTEESLTIPAEYEEYIKSQVIRKAAEAMIANPLSQESIESFELLNENRETLFTCDKASSKSYKYKKQSYEQIIEEECKNVQIKFLSIHVDRSINWRIEVFGVEYTVPIHDKEFLAQVRNGNVTNLTSNTFEADLLLEEDVFTSKKKYIVKKVYTPNRSERVSTEEVLEKMW